MAVINVLDKHTAELIAAGEVVEKPASVVKELVENSIDAGSENITIEIENGGIKKILVQDDGSGIDSEYVRTAFIRHATSKISQKEDLDKISSLGFRGEALASIASVSRITLITKTQQQDFGIEFKSEGGQETEFNVKPSTDGTRFIVRDLFYNTPARMKFLKKDSTEAGYIQEILINLALSNPNISFTFKKDGKNIFSTVGDGNLKNTIACLFNTDFVNQICEVNYSDEKYKIWGYTTFPQFSRQSRNMQFVFINGRYVKNKTVMAACENAYNGTVMTGKFPGYVININMPYDCIDVNVHPAKTEVRFANEKEVFYAVYRAVKSAVEDNPIIKKVEIKNNIQTQFISENSTVKQQSFTEIKSDFIHPKTDLKLNISLDEFKNRYVNNDKKEPVYLKNDNLILNSSSDAVPYTSGKKVNLSIPYEESYPNQKTEDLDTNTEQSDAVNTDIANISVYNEVSNNENKTDLENISVIGEVFSTYIICQCGNELILIDKHAAHERLLYEKLKSTQCFDKQYLLLPLGINLSAAEKNAVMENKKMLEEQGFEFEDMGLNGIMLRAVPINISSENPQSLMEEIAHNLSEGNLSYSEKLEWTLHSVACRSAIKAGDKAVETELKQLVNDIKSNKIPLFCPHGRPVIISMTKKEIEKQFGRA